MTEVVDKKDLTVGDLRRANIPEHFWFATMASIPSHLDYLPKLMNYYAKMDELMSKGVGLYLFSTENQTGKSSIAVALVKRALRLKKTAFFSEAGLLKNALTKNQEFEDHSLLDQRIRVVDLLVVDDFGKEYRTQSGYAENTFENILRDRVQSVKPTIITSNMHPKDIEKVYSVSLAALLKGHLIPVQITGHNWSTEKQKELKNML